MCKLLGNTTPPGSFNPGFRDLAAVKTRGPGVDGQSFLLGLIAGSSQARHNHSYFAPGLSVCVWHHCVYSAAIATAYTGRPKHYWIAISVRIEVWQMMIACNL